MRVDDLNVSNIKTANKMHRTQSGHARLDYLSRETYAKHTTELEQKRFDFWSLSPALRNLWLLLVEDMSWLDFFVFSQCLDRRRTWHSWM